MGDIILIALLLLFILLTNFVAYMIGSHNGYTEGVVAVLIDLHDRVLEEMENDTEMDCE